MQFMQLKHVAVLVVVLLPATTNNIGTNILESPAANFRVQWRHHVPIRLVAVYQTAWHYISKESNFYGQINPSAFDNL